MRQYVIPGVVVALLGFGALSGTAYIAGRISKAETENAFYRLGLVKCVVVEKRQDRLPEPVEPPKLKK